MRSSKEIFDIILKFAQKNPDILAVYMNGSRANPRVEPDEFQDYDIVFVVRETQPFLDNTDWIKYFGELAVMQEPDSKEFGWGKNSDKTESYTWLMLFKDGNRIDLQIQTVDKMYEDFKKDSLTVVLMDKDGILPEIPESDDIGYWIKRPDISEYRGCCNEFWWCLNNIAKGIIRDQLPYVMRMYNTTVHVELDRMLTWYIGVNTDFSVSTGMWGKYFKKYLSGELYVSYCRTFPDSDYDNMKKALSVSCELFRKIAGIVGERLNFPYNRSDDENMTYYLRKILG